jgi:hypothetical protein
MGDSHRDAARTTVHEQYAGVAAATEPPGCGVGCCSPKADASLALGYSPTDLASAPEGANMGLGCGNP